jgi:hypothetical protein
VKHPQTITLKLKDTDIEIKNYLLELEKENAKLQKNIAKLQVRNVSLQNRPKPPRIQYVVPHEENRKTPDTKEQKKHDIDL